MFQLFSVFFAASLVAVAVSSPAVLPSHFEPKSGFEFLGTVEGKVLLRPSDAAQNPWTLTYQEALVKCNSAGYRIATIESEAQYQIIKPYSCGGTGGGTIWYWIDGVAFQKANVFFSINTGRNLTFFDWDTGRPGGDDKMRCLRASCTNGHEFSMVDFYCTEKYNVICEISA